MGDRTYTDISFAGTISEEQGEELLQLLRDQGCESGSTDSSKIDLDALRSGHGFYDHECNYAQMEKIENWCGANNVSYLKTWAQGGGYGPGMTLYDAGTNVLNECAALESAPALSLNDLIRANAAGEIDKLIIKLSKFTGFKADLKVLAVDDWTDELCHFMAKRALLADA